MKSSISSRRSAHWQPEHVFTLLLAVFGLAFAFGMPPCQVADEISHFHRAYHISEGHLVPEMVGEWGGGLLPASILRVAQTFGRLAFHPENQARWEDFRSLSTLPLNRDERSAVPFHTAYYTFVPYLPQALGMALTRWLGLGPLGIFYAGRLANLFLALLLVYGAIRITPVFKLVFGSVALLPISVHQFASLSYDGCTIGVSFLLAAVFLRLAVDGKARAGGGVSAVLHALTGWLTLCKFPYVLLILLYLAVPVSRFGGWRRYLLTAAGLVLIASTMTAASMHMKKYAPGRMSSVEGPSIDLQMRFIRRHPARFAEICSVTVAEHGKLWIDHLACLGWLDTRVNPLAVHLFFLFMVVVVLGDRTEGFHAGARLKMCALASVLLSALWILAALYICGNAVRAPLILGVQGRYFVPLLPLLLLCFSNRTVRVEVHPRLLLALTAGACTSVLLVAVVSFVRRYYFAPPVQLRVMPIALAAALLLFAGTAIFARQRYRPKRTGGASGPVHWRT